MSKTIRRVPKVKPRRLYDRKQYPGYLEGDRDWTENNMDACIWFLKNRDRIAAQLKATAKA
jgi:hypothetical protein